MGANNIRKLKVYRSTNSNSGSDTPTIRLDGKWLQEYGFNTGDFISVECKGGELIIRKDTDRIEEETASNHRYVEQDVKERDQRYCESNRSNQQIENDRLSVQTVCCFMRVLFYLSY